MSGAATASFVYDGDGRRVKGTVNGVTSYYVGDQYEVSGGVVKKYYTAGGRRIALRSGGTLTWLLSDHLGGTAVTVSGTAETGEVRYKAFGATRFTSGTTPTSVRFTGQQEAASLGLYDYGARWYDPALGQFLSPDTIVPAAGNALDYHRYAYTRFNPVRYTDPTGHYSIDELKEHFGVSSFDDLMRLFDEGGAYAGLDGWYDILRAAQDGDTISASNPLAGGYSLTGTFMRSAQGKIQIAHGQEVVSESVFAHFGGIIVRGAAGQESIAGIGTYELRGQQYAWRIAIAGIHRQWDMSSCNNVDCVAVAIDGVGMVGAGLQIASPACMEFAFVCNGGGRALSVFSTGAGVIWMGWNAWQGNATTADIAATVTTTAIGVITDEPKINLAAGAAQFMWDATISPQQR